MSASSSSKKAIECIDLTGYSSDIAPPTPKAKAKPKAVSKPKALPVAQPLPVPAPVPVPQPKAQPLKKAIKQPLPQPIPQPTLQAKAPPIKKVMKELPSSKKKKKLEAFNEMPLDILQEICYHLEPISLLSLTLTAKKFRNYLTSSTSNVIWINAREKFGLPTLTVSKEDMNEIQYAHLIWNRNCTLCRVKVGANREVNFECRVLLCDRCQNDNIVPSQSTHMQKMMLMGLHPWAPLFSPEYSRGQTYLPAVVTLAKVFESKGIIRNEAMSGIRGKYADIFEVMKTGLLLRVDDIKALIKWRIATKEREAKEKAEVLKRIADGRKEELLGLAIATGWTESYFTQVLLNEKVIKRAIETSSSQWGRWLVKVETFLEELRNDQSALADAQHISNRRWLVKSIYDAMVSAGNYDTRTYTDPWGELVRSRNSYLPMYAWIELPTVRSIWKNPLSLNFDSTHVRRELWPQINIEVAEYTSKVKLAIFRSLLESHTKAHLNFPSIVSKPPTIFDHDAPTTIEMDSYFNEPTSLINCKQCLKSSVYPDILRHVCVDSKTVLPHVLALESPWEEFIKDGEEFEYWNIMGNNLRTSVEGVVAAFVMLKAYEKEVSDVSPKERLSSLSDKVFTCVTCSDSHDLDRMSVSETVCHFIKLKHYIGPREESEGRESRLLGPRRLIELVYGNDHLY